MLRNNFFKTAFTSMLVVFALGFYSCSSDDNGEPDTPPPGDEKNIIGKWEVKNGTGDYGSFEFTSDKKYIIEQHVSGNNPRAVKSRAETNYIIIIFGDYSATNIDGNTYTLDLKEFGIITITIENGNATITVNGETYDTSKAKEVNTNEQTELLCHTWKLDKVRAYTPSDEDDPEWIQIGDGETLTFTNNGTYVAYYPNLDDDDKEFGIPEYEPGTWKWIDSNTIEITSKSYHMSDTSGEESAQIWTETEIDRFKVTELTNNKFTLDVIPEFNPEEYDPEDEYTMWLSR